LSNFYSTGLWRTGLSILQSWN